MTRRIWIVLVAAACGGGGSKPIKIHDFSDALRDAECDHAVECGQMPDKATCLAAVARNNYMVATIVADVDAGTIKYDEGLAGQCVDATRNAGCTFTGYYGGSTACRDMYTGTVADAAPCFIDVECAKHGTCNPTDPSCDPGLMCCAGTCNEPPVAPIGGDCSMASCGDNAYCNSTNKCAAPATAVGATCDALEACASPLICNVGGGSVGTCKRPAAHGATCEPNALLPCADERDYCDSGSKLCTPRAAIGQPCPSSNGVECVLDATCTNQMCLAKPSAGMQCSTSGPSCLGELECTNNLCVLPPAGMACM